LSGVLESYAGLLNEERFSHESFLSKTRFVMHFSRWLHKHGMGVKDLTLTIGKRFLRACPSRRSGDPTTLKHFLNWMCSQELIPPQALQAHKKSEVETLIEEYSSYLLAERGLLRHRDPNTTRIYAKVDLKSLREVALPWPGTPL
jgi:site-specific recombinase XerD